MQAHRCGVIGKQHRRIFLDAVATGCNVAAAARAIGKETSTLYRLRQRDAEFAAQWADALQAGYAHLESELLARAMGERGEGEAPAAFDPELAMKLMSHHKAIARGSARRSAPLKVATLAELADALDKRFATLDRRRPE